MLGESMNASTFTPPTPSSSSSKSLNTFGPMTSYTFTMSPNNLSRSIEGRGSMGESEADGMGESVGDDDDEDRDESRGSRGSSRDTKDGGLDKRKPRVTLPRGGACVVCRNRKLKCTGERPCKSCEKAGQDCRYEEVQRRKPKAVILEERLAELERLVGLSPGEAIDNARKRLQPSPSITSQVHDMFITHSTPSSTPLLIPGSSGQSPLQLSLNSYRDMIQTPQLNATPLDIPPNSTLEFALISLILPYTPYLLMPVHPQRFLTLLGLPANDPSRPHPALLYIMFTEAVLVLERGTPLPKAPRPPYSLFPQACIPPMPHLPTDLEELRRHMAGRAPLLLERARTELDNGIRNVDRPFDLVRAAVGIARHLYSLGRFIEGWNIPVSRLTISCGLHRLTGNYTSPDGYMQSPSGLTNPMPASYAHADKYPRPIQHMKSPDGSTFPILRMRPVILPPARDEIEVAERNATFWAAKMQDWAAGVGWGWTIALADEECTTEWPWGNGIPEAKPSAGISRPDHRSGIRELYDMRGMGHTVFPETTYALALKSVALLHRASHLFDLPIASYPTPNGRPSHIAPRQAIQEIQTSLHVFREQITPIFTYQPGAEYGGSGSISPDGFIESYDSFNDPWFILLHANLYTAEMMMWKEMTHYEAAAYDRAVGCARAMVVFIRHMGPEHWVHVDMTVALDVSLCSRFLFKESERLRLHGAPGPAAIACEEAESLRLALTGEFSRWMPMASLHGLIVQRVRKGWSEKEGEYERI